MADPYRFDVFDTDLALGKVRHDETDNAAKVVGTVSPGGFWEKPLETADLITVGLRSHYVASFHAAPLLIDGGTPRSLRHELGGPPELHPSLR
jgi:hypothetical protein